jgi:hypothetical protein
MARPFVQAANECKWTKMAQFGLLYLVALFLSNQYFMGIMGSVFFMLCWIFYAWFHVLDRVRHEEVSSI